MAFRAAWLRIDWLAEGKARTIDAGLVDLETETADDGVDEIALDIFPNDYGWLGLQLEAEAVPAWVTAGERKLFRRVTSVQGEAWWVPALDWQPDKGRPVNAFLRGLGQFDLDLGGQSLRVVTRHHGTVRLEDYLRDFRDELFWLVLGQEGSGTVGHGGGGDLGAAFAAFGATVAKVADDLPRNLREVIATGPRARLRPNAASFRALQRNPQAQRLPGRQAVETADMPDNRFLMYMIEWAQRLGQILGRTGLQQAEALSRRAADLAAQSATLASTTHEDVDPEIFDAQLEDLARRFERLRTWTPQEPRRGKTRILRFSIEDPFMNSDTRFFVARPSGDRTRQVIDLPAEVAELVRENRLIEKDYAFEIAEGDYLPVERLFNNGNPYIAHEVAAIQAIRPSGTSLDIRSKKRLELEAKGWQVRLDKRALAEYQQASRIAMVRATHVAGLAKRAEQIDAILNREAKRLSRLQSGLAAEGVRPSPLAPDGLRWRMNPPHVACLAAFRVLQAQAREKGLDLDSLARLERIETLHASALYERWCLVKVLSILTGDFGFRLPEGWQARLVDAVTQPQGCATFDLVRSDLLLMARLEIQPLLPNGRRPDLRLRLAYVVSGADANHLDAQFEQVPGLVLDAKFRNAWKGDALERMVEGLLTQKGYGETGCAVFVLQPCGGAVRRPTSPLSWGRSCDYGQDHECNHRCGHVWLAPDADRADPSTHLRRLLALYLQSRFARPIPIFPESMERALAALPNQAVFGVGRKQDDRFWLTELPDWRERKFFSASFCISCGKAHVFADVLRKLTRRGDSEYWDLTCSDCGMLTTRTHCYACGNTVLFKNHVKLTYHRTIAEEPTHVVCPCCRAYFDEDYRNTQRGGWLGDP